jgi:hypothetical protein
LKMEPGEVGEAPGVLFDIPSGPAGES